VPTKFVSDLIMEATGPGVLSSPPEIDRSLGPRPGDSNNTGKTRAFIVKFLRFQEKEAVLKWARQQAGLRQHRVESLSWSAPS
ncbi:hypothetical protein KUCAC02_010116, partial [Chaenocephalus aceratus]